MRKRWHVCGISAARSLTSALFDAIWTWVIKRVGNSVEARVVVRSEMNTGKTMTLAGEDGEHKRKD
jgi:hypothetical protein